METLINNNSKVDFYISMPLMEVHKICRDKLEINPKADILKVLENRAKHELCVQQIDDDSDSSIFARVKRTDVDRLKLKIFKNDEQDDFQVYLVDIFSSVDIRSNMAVLTLYAIGVDIEISTLADCITRSKILVSKDGNNYEMIYTYILREYGFIKKGNPKLFITVHEDPKKVDMELIASVLFGEQYFGKNSTFGEIVDKEIMEKLSEKYGIAQYSYAKAYAHKNVLLQLSSNFPDEIEELLYLEGMSLFYIEMLLFEEAAITINSDKITKFLLNEKSSSLTKRLKQIYEINSEYSKTLEFRQMLLYYPTSSRSMKLIREAFGIEEMSERLEKNKSILQNIFDAQRDILNTWETSILNAFALFITIIAIINFLTRDNFDMRELIIVPAIIVIYFFSRWRCFTQVGRREKR